MWSSAPCQGPSAVGSSLFTTYRSRAAPTCSSRTRSIAWLTYQPHRTVMGPPAAAGTTPPVALQGLAGEAAVPSAAYSTPNNRMVWEISRQGSLGNLQQRTEPLPELQPGQALVAVRALGLNFADVFCCLGLYKAAPKGAFVPGLEFAGEVVAIAPTTGPAQPTSQDTKAPHTTSNSSSSSMAQTPPPPAAATAAAHPNLQVGDRVLGVTRFGAFATHVALDTAYLRPIPAGWSYEQAAAFPVQTLTAAYGLFSCGGLQPGDAVLVQSAAGGVGLQALQICRTLGCAVLGLVGSQDKVQLLEQQFKHALGSPPAVGPHGNDPQLQQQQHQHHQQQQQTQQVTAGSSSESAGGNDSRPLHFAVRQQDAAAIQQQLAGFLAEQQLQGFNVVLDAVAGPYFRPSYAALQPTGRYVIFGAAALTPPPGASLQVGLGLLNPVNLLAAARLVWGWVNRPKLDVLAMPGDNKSVCGFNLIWLYNQQRLLAGLYATVERLQLPAPLVGHTYTWQQLPEALAFLQSGRSVGKVVVAVAPADAAAVPDA